MRKLCYSLIFVLTCFFVLPAHKTDEGMFPLSHLNQVDLKNAGFRIGEKDIYNPDGIALTDALVRLGGCTGSFVSDQGLIITNHHCVFGSVAELSSTQQDYLENGFYAKTRSNELKTSMTCKITKSYEDVSLKVLDGINLKMDPIKKKEMIRTNVNRLREEEQKKYPELSIEISEMFVGYSYTLFRYQILKDIRLVYVPPRTIGEFGGETDNWEWPKHTGDFSFVRAYVGKDGKPANYSEDNVPFVPKKHLKINPKGTRNKDLVFILGYPGTTFRQEPAQFIRYQQDHILPFISEWYGWRMQNMENLGKTDRDRYLRMAGTIKQLANTKKNFEGKMYGLKQTGLLETKSQEQIKLIEKMKSLGVNTDFFKQIDSLYSIRLENANRDLLLNRFNQDCGALIAALAVENLKNAFPNKKKLSKEDLEKFKTELKKQLINRYKIIDTEMDMNTLSELIKRGAKLDGKQSIAILQKTKNPDKFVANAYKNSIYSNPSLFFKLLDSVPMQIFKNKDALQKFAAKLLPTLKESSDQTTAVNDKLNTLLPLLLDARIQYENKKFIPDANSTLRFTYGYISGYKEGLNKHLLPFTHRKEIFEKNATDNVDYRLSTPVRELLLTERIASDLLDPETNDLVVCMLYNMDTTGGNSGSPVMDADGNLVGVNFDRAYTATLNDYSWNADYSRSIAVDIRYVLFTMKYLNQADNLISEMGVSL